MSFSNHNTLNINLLGKTVTHQSWGNGLVEKHEKNRIVVHFQNTNSGERSVQFDFPGAFAQGYLTINDPNLHNQIAQIIESQKCKICGQSHPKTEVIDNIRVCENCKREKIEKCSQCNKIYNKSLAVTIVTDPYWQTTEKVCPSCAKTETFICQQCHRRFHTKNKAPELYNNDVLCIECFDEYAKICHFCNSIFSVDEGETLYDEDGNDVNVCPSCIKTQTFTCSKCDSATLTSLKVVSKFISPQENICIDCTNTCVLCHEKIKTSNTFSSFNKNYCPDCWSIHKHTCSICGDDFIGGTDTICPDCENAKAYEHKLQAIDFCSFCYKEFKHYSLEYIDRCAMFTDLYEHCRKSYLHHNSEEDQFGFIVMDLYGRRIVITHLDPNIRKNSKHSLNITMTKFRSHKGQIDVIHAIDQWLPSSTTYIDTSAGKLRILNYPVLLRVQTKYDKVYGKEWNGPYDYTEIGNYGDTTDFYIIGILI